jgi:hypothetical protein
VTVAVLAHTARDAAFYVLALMLGSFGHAKTRITRGDSSCGVHRQSSGRLLDSAKVWT